MTSSVQSVPAAHPKPHAARHAGRAPQTGRSFASALKAMQEPRPAHLNDSSAKGKDASAGAIELSQPLTISSLADAIVALIASLQAELPQRAQASDEVPLLPVDSPPPAQTDEPATEPLPALALLEEVPPSGERPAAPVRRRNLPMAILNVSEVVPALRLVGLDESLTPVGPRANALFRVVPAERAGRHSGSSANSDELVFRLTFPSAPAPRPDSSIPMKAPATPADTPEEAIAGPPVKRIEETQTSERQAENPPHQEEPAQAQKQATPQGARPVVLAETPYQRSVPGDHAPSSPGKPPSTNPAETAAPDPPKPAAAPMLQRIGFLVRGLDQLVRLDVRQAMGEVRVAVYADDAVLAARLRDSLPELLTRLDDRGVQAGATLPVGHHRLESSSLPDSGHHTGQNAEEWSHQPAHHQQRERNPRQFRQAMAWELQDE